MGKDNWTGTDVTMDYDHSLIHNQKKFAAHMVSASVAASGKTYIRFTTPAISKGLVHLRLESPFSTATLSKARLYERCTGTSGTVVAPKNYFRNAIRSDGINRKDCTCLLFYNAATAPTLANGRTLLSASAGGGFSNQPAGDGIEILSSSASDINIVATVYGTKTGTTTTITKEQVTLTGTTAVSTTTTTWQNILGVEIDKVAAGTITFREASGNLAVTTITHGNLSSGIYTPTVFDATAEIPFYVASDTSTAPVGLWGDNGIYESDNTVADANVVTSVVALNNTTNVNALLPFTNVTKVMLGAVAANRNVTVSVPYATIINKPIGVGGTPASASGGEGSPLEERVLGPSLDYLLELENLSGTTATVFHVNITYYLE